jgi:hypothetical protein
MHHLYSVEQYLVAPALSGYPNYPSYPIALEAYENVWEGIQVGSRPSTY